MFVTALYKVHVYMLSGHSVAQEIKHIYMKVYQWFYWT